MMTTASAIYKDIAERTGGDIYVGVVGPVRTGKSTFVKRLMELLVIPNIENIYQRERAKDELPQSGSGRTIMTSEPKFVPEEAVTIAPDPSAPLSVRLIDSVGYVIPGALGAEEDGQPRLISTPWYPNEIPMTQAAELGTKKIMEEHCSIGIVLTTDGSIHEIPREDYLEAEDRAIRDMQSTGKPFIILLNSSEPNGIRAQTLRQNLEKTHHVTCLCVDCLKMQEETIRDILSAVLFEFPMSEIHVDIPRWLNPLPLTHMIKSSLYQALLGCAEYITTIREAEERLQTLCDLEYVDQVRVNKIDPASGIVSCEVLLKSGLFYETISACSGFEVSDDAALLSLLKELSIIKRDYDKISDALNQVYATGYGIVMPSSEEMHLESPQIVRKGSNYGVRLKASAPSIHMLRADIETEISPMVGDEKQSEDLLHYLLREYEGDTAKLWESNIFGKSVFELVNEGLTTKLRRMPDEARSKLQATLSRIINEGSSGLLCIILS